jgi:hypothetical protein
VERRTPLKAGTKGLKRTPLKQGDKPLERKSELRRVTPLDSGREGMRSMTARRLTPEDQATGNPLGRKAVPFKAKSPANRQRCFRCKTRAAQWHHWLGQEHLRVMVRGLRLPVEEGQRVLRGLLRDERNLSPVCMACHEFGEGAGLTRTVNGTQFRGRFMAEEVPESAGVFAMELDDMLEAAGRPREAVVRLLREWT